MHIQNLGETEFITLDRSDKDYWRVGIDKILRSFAKIGSEGNEVGRSVSNSARAGVPVGNDVEQRNPAFWPDLVGSLV